MLPQHDVGVYLALLAVALKEAVASATVHYLVHAAPSAGYALLVEHPFYAVLHVVVGHPFVGILQALAMTGAVEFDMAFPILMGIGIGASVPVMLSALGASTNGKRTAFVYLVIDVIGAILVGSIFYAVNAAVGFSFMTQKMMIEADDAVFDKVVEEAVKCIAKVEPDCQVVL